MRIGLIGCGNWGRYILRDLRALGCEVPVVARSATSIERAETGGAAAVTPEIGALGGVDGIVVATPSTTHAAIVERALELGTPVFCEKPLCTDPADAARLVGLAPDRLFVMDKWRYHPGVLELSRIAREGVLGAVRGLKSVRVGWGESHDDTDCVWHLAPHDLSIALEILGRLLPPVAAAGHHEDGYLFSLTGLLRDDDAFHAVEVSERSPERIRRIELHCEDGVAVLAGGWDEHVVLYRPDGTHEPVEERVETPGELPLLSELRAFVAHLGGGPPPRSSAAEGAAIVESIARLRELATRA